MPDEPEKEDLAETRKETISGSNEIATGVETTGEQTNKSTPNFLIPKLVQGDAEPGAPLPENLSALAEATDKVEKTKLDYEQVNQIVSEKVEKNEVELSERIKNQTFEPPIIQKELVFKTAAPCASVCNESDKSSRVSYCERCQLRVYDLEKMNKEEADHLIYKMEGTRDLTLYKRADGKFLIKNCPVGQRNILQTTLITFIARMLLLTYAYVALSTPPPRRDVHHAKHQETTDSSAVDSTSVDSSAVDSRKAAPAVVKDNDGWTRLTPTKKQKTRVQSEDFGTASSVP